MTARLVRRRCPELKPIAPAIPVRCFWPVRCDREGCIWCRVHMLGADSPLRVKPQLK